MHVKCTLGVYDAYGAWLGGDPGGAYGDVGAGRTGGGTESGGGSGGGHTGNGER